MRGSPLSGRKRTPSATVKDGVWVDGTLVRRWLVSTVLRRTDTEVPGPPRIGLNAELPSYSHIGK
jgi:hypothetical protein